MRGEIQWSETIAPGRERYGSGLRDRPRGPQAGLHETVGRGCFRNGQASTVTLDAGRQRGGGRENTFRIVTDLASR